MNVLLIYDYYAPQPLRQAIKEYLECFGKYSEHSIYYCNYAFGLPKYLSAVSFDLILFHNFFSAQFRWNNLPYEIYLKRLMPLKKYPAKKAILCQDEFIRMNYINRFVSDFAVDHIFSVAEESEWPKIYPDVDPQKVKIHKVLTGYLDDQILETLKKLEDENINREIDIGYRASHVPHTLGKQGQLKNEIGKRLREAKQAMGLKTSIKLVGEEQEMLSGLDWYRFMLSCKAVAGVEGGSSILDFDGSLEKKVSHFTQKNPKADFNAVKAHCFSEIDGNLNLKALSPRHLEACATKTCQLLVEGDYSGILKPHLHYIPIKEDFSDVEEALTSFKDENYRKTLTERAFKDIVLSKKYCLSSFVKKVIKECEVKKESPKKPLILMLNKLRDNFLKKRIPLEFRFWKKIKHLVPKTIETKIKLMRNRSHES